MAFFSRKRQQDHSAPPAPAVVTQVITPPPTKIARMMPPSYDPLPPGVVDEIVTESLTFASMSQVIQQQEAAIQMRDEENMWLRQDRDELRDFLQELADRVRVEDAETMALLVAMNRRLVESHANDAIADTRFELSQTGVHDLKELQRRLSASA